MADNQQNLLIRFRLENQQAISQANAFQRAITAQNRAMQQTVPVAKSMGKQMQQTGIISKQWKGFVQQAGFQVADFAIVMQQGQGAMRAFAVQGGQLLSFLPLIGPIVGGIVTVVGLLGAAWLDATGKGLKFEDRIKSIDEALGDYRNTIDLLNKNPLELSEDFGSTASNQGPLLALAALLQQQQALEAVQNAYSALTAEMVESSGQTDALRANMAELEANEFALARLYEERYELMEQNRRGVAEYTEAINNLEDQETRLKATIEELASELNLSVDQFDELNAQLTNLESATTAEGYVQAMAEFADWIKQSGIDLKKLPPELRLALQNMTLLGTEAGKFVDATEDAADTVDLVGRKAAEAAAQAQKIAAAFQSAAEAARKTALNALSISRGNIANSEDALREDQAYLNELQTSGDEYAATLARINAEYDNRLNREVDLSKGSDLYLKTQIDLIEGERELALERARVTEETRKTNEALSEQERLAKAGGKAAKDAAQDYARFQAQVQKEIEASSIYFQDLAEIGIGGFVDALFDANKSFKDFARDFLVQIGKMILKQMLLNMLVGALGGGKGPLIVGGVSPTGLGGFQAFAKGGVVDGPTYFPTSNGMGLMGEAGPEAILPLSRDSSGNLGISGSATVVNVYNNASGVEVQTQKDGNEISIFIERAVAATQGEFARQMATGQGVFARSLEAGFHTRRKAT